MDDVQDLLERQASWQKARKDLSWAEKVRMVETARESIRRWRIADAHQRKHALRGTLAPGQPLTVRLAPPVALSNAGGNITLLDDRGLKVHGVSYTKQQAVREGRTIVF